MIVFLLYSSMALLSWNLKWWLLSFRRSTTSVGGTSAPFLLSENRLHLRGYVCYRKDTVDGLGAHGHAPIIVHDSIHSKEIALKSTLPVVADKVTKTDLSFVLCFCIFLLVSPYLQPTSLTCFSNSQPPSSSMVTSMPTTPSGALVGPVREGCFLRNYFLLIISFFLTLENWHTSARLQVLPSS